MRCTLCFLLLVLGTSARADYFNFKGDPAKNNPLDSNEGGSVVGVTLSGTQAGLVKGAANAQAGAWKTFKGGGSSASIGQQLAIRDTLKGGVAIIEKAGPAIDHVPWMSTAAGEVSTGHYTQGLFTAMNGIAKAAATGIATTVGATFGSAGGPVGAVAGGTSAGYATAWGYDATAGKLFEAIKNNLGAREDAAQIKGLASDKMGLGYDPDKTLAETHAKYQEFVQARKDKEKAEADKKTAEAKAAEAANKLAETKAAEAARQKAAGEAARQRLKETIADSKWESTANLTCTGFSVFLSAPVQFDSTGHARPADDWHKTVSENMDLEIKDKEKRGEDCFLIKGTGFDYEFQREREWYGLTAHYRISGVLAKDLSAITSLTVSCRMDALHYKNSDGNLEREKEKSWSATILNIPADAENDDPREHNYQTSLDTETLKLPKECRVTQTEFVETDTYYVYSLVHASDEKTTLTETIRTTAGTWDVTRPGSNIVINITIKKRKGM